MAQFNMSLNLNTKKKFFFQTNRSILICLFNIETRALIYSSNNSILIDYRVHSNQVRSLSSHVLYHVYRSGMNVKCQDHMRKNIYRVYFVRNVIEATTKTIHI